MNNPEVSPEWLSAWDQYRQGLHEHEEIDDERAARQIFYAGWLAGQEKLLVDAPVEWLE